MSQTNVQIPKDARTALPAGLRRTAGVLGTIACTAGTRALLRGAAEVPGNGAVSANVDSEYRFYAGWYPVVGAALLRVARGAPVDERFVIRGCAAGLLLAASGRARSMRTVGRPHWSQVVLMAIEFVIPAVLLPWQAKAVSLQPD